MLVSDVYLHACKFTRVCIRVHMRTFTYVCKIYIYVKFAYVCKCVHMNCTLNWVSLSRGHFPCCLLLKLEMLSSSIYGHNVLPR